MSRFDRLPGIDSENNTTRRNVLVGSGYAILGIGILGAAGDDTEDDPGDNAEASGPSDGGDDGDGSDGSDGDGGGGDSSDGDDGGDGEDGDDGTDEPPRSDADELMHISETLGSDEPLFDPATTTFSGSGATVTDRFELARGYVVFAFEHNGESNFIVEAEDSAGNTSLIVNKIGSVSGATGLPADAGEYLLDIDADAAWEINAGQPISPAEEIRTLPVSASGEGPAVVGPVEIEGSTTVTGSHDGERNFIVEANDEGDYRAMDTELVFNEIGTFEGETRMQKTGILWLSVDADGTWELSIEE